MANNVDPKIIVGVIQWVISALAIPALFWAWTLSSDVKVQQREIEDMKEDVREVEQLALQLARLNANLDNLKDKIDDIKELLRD